MSFKLMGLCLIFISGILAAFAVKKKYEQRLKVLLEFSRDFEYYINSVSYKKMTAPEITENLLKDKQGIARNFYEKILGYLKNGGDYSVDFINKDMEIEKEDASVLTEFFLSLGKSDYENQLKEMEFLKKRLDDCIKQANEVKEKKQKTDTALVMSLFLTLIIFLV